MRHNTMKMALLAGALMSFPWTVRAGYDPIKPVRNPGTPSNELTDDMIEERKKMIREQYQRYASELDTRYKKRAEMETQYKNDRIALEKKLAEERLAFLDGLKVIPHDARGEAMRSISQKQREERTAFRETWRAKLKEYRQEIIDEHDEFREDMKKTKETASEKK